MKPCLLVCSAAIIAINGFSARGAVSDPRIKAASNCWVAVEGDNANNLILALDFPEGAKVESTRLRYRIGDILQQHNVEWDKTVDGRPRVHTVLNNRSRGSPSGYSDFRFEAPYTLESGKCKASTTFTAGPKMVTQSYRVLAPVGQPVEYFRVFGRNAVPEAKFDACGIKGDLPASGSFLFNDCVGLNAYVQPGGRLGFTIWPEPSVVKNDMKGFKVWVGNDTDTVREVRAEIGLK